MTVSFPLSLKVSLCLLLNLLLLGAVALGFFVVQGGLNWDALVSGSAGSRLQSLGNIVAGEVAVASESTREEVLARFSAAYNAELRLVSPDGRRVAGGRTELPPAVWRRIDSRPNRPGPGGMGPRGEPGRFRPPPNPFPPEPRDQPGPERPGGPRGPGGPGDWGPDRRDGPSDRGPARFVVKTNQPAAYWLGVGVALRSPGSPPEPVVLIAHSSSLWDVLGILELQTWLFAAAAVLVLSILFWWPLVRGITRSVARLTFATERIAEGHFDTRVAAHGRDELGKLGESVNRMAARLDTLVTGQKRFLGDVAHELCSPLARLQLATSILEERATETTRGAVADVREEVQEMSALVNELLAFTKAGMKPRKADLREVELAPLLAVVLARETVDGQVVTQVPAALRVRVDPDLLARALGNLVRNALRYAGGAGPIAITAGHHDGRVVVTIDDEGPGVPPDALHRLGEPFYRPEAARTRETGGIGLGLAIVRSSIVACGGEVRFSNRTPTGFRAELSLTAI